MLELNFDPFPELFTERLQLRRITENDSAEILGLRSDPRVMKYLDRDPLTSIEEAKGMIHKIETALQQNAGITWGVCLKDDPKLIGWIGFWQITKEHYRGEIGYMLNPDFQGKGIMQEAMGVVLPYGFKNLKLHSVEANVNPANQSSIRLLEKAGFKQEAYFRENYYYNGKFIDSAIFSLLDPGS